MEHVKELLREIEREHNEHVARLEWRVEELARDRLAIRELLTEAQAKADPRPMYAGRRLIDPEKPLGWSLNHPDGTYWFLCTDHPPDFPGWTPIGAGHPFKREPAPGYSLHCGVCDLDLRPATA